MAKVTYIEFNGSRHVVDVDDGQTVMQGAVSNMLPGILAECGGACACATCHVYIDPPWNTRVNPPGETETAMLDVVLFRREASRLSCQVKFTAALDGLVVQLPESQV